MSCELGSIFVLMDDLFDQFCCMEKIIDGIVVGIWEWNIQIGQMWVNECWVGIVGYMCEELVLIILEIFFWLVYLDDFESFNVLLKEYLEGCLLWFDSLCWMCYKDGYWIWVQDCGCIYEWDVQGWLVWMVGVYVDVIDLQIVCQDVVNMCQCLQVVVDVFDEVVVIVIDIDGVVNLFNIGVQKLFGYSVDEVIGWVNFGFFYDVEEMCVYLQQDVGDGVLLFSIFQVLIVCVVWGIWLYQWIFVCKDGECCQVCLLISLLDCVSGLWIGYVGMVVDIILLLVICEQVYVVVEKFVGVFFLVVFGMVLVLFEGCWLDVNDVFCGIFGYICVELLQIDFQILIYFEDLYVDLILVGDLFVGCCDYYYMDKCYLGKVGNIVWGWLLVLLVCVGNGELLYFVLQIQDVIVQCQSGQQLCEFEQCMWIMLDVVVDMVVILDLYGMVQYVNVVVSWVLVGVGVDGFIGSWLVELMELIIEYVFCLLLDLFVFLDLDSNVVDLYLDLLLVVGVQWVLVDFMCVWLCGEDGVISGVVWVICDVIQQCVCQCEVCYLVEVDLLIELSNCCGFEVYLQQVIICVVCIGQQVLLMYIDLDYFKFVNDMYGYFVGDVVLWVVVSLLWYGVCDLDIVV